LSKRKVFFSVISLLTILTCVQIALDYMDERELSRKSAKVNKEMQYCIFIEIEDKTLYLLQDGKCVKSYPVASGMLGLPSPLGYWKVIEKGDWGEGFGGRWIGLNIPWCI